MYFIDVRYSDWKKKKSHKQIKSDHSPPTQAQVSTLDFNHVGEKAFRQLLQIPFCSDALEVTLAFSSLDVNTAQNAVHKKKSASLKGGIDEYKNVTNRGKSM